MRDHRKTKITILWLSTNLTRDRSIRLPANKPTADIQKRKQISSIATKWVRTRCGRSIWNRSPVQWQRMEKHRKFRAISNRPTNDLVPFLLRFPPTVAWIRVSRTNDLAFVLHLFMSHVWEQLPIILTLEIRSFLDFSYPVSHQCNSY